jgi:hypothetical protein
MIKALELNRLICNKKSDVMMLRPDMLFFIDQEGQKIPAGLLPIIDAHVQAHYTFKREKLVLIVHQLKGTS